MIKLTAKEIARLIKRKEGYVLTLLGRRKIKLKQEHLKDVLDLICEYRIKEKIGL